jgi:hypothetical protein
LSANASLTTTHQARCLGWRCLGIEANSSKSKPSLPYVEGYRNSRSQRRAENRRERSQRLPFLADHRCAMELESYRRVAVPL